ARVAQDMGEIDTLVYNAGSGVFANIEDLTAEDFELSWRINAAGLFNAAKAVIPAMKAKGSGSIVIIGATASRRGAPMTAAFAPAKAAQRSLAESMAKHLGPTGIHVALIIVDGMIDLPRSRSMMPDKPEDFFIQPAHVAETAHWLAQQPRSAWSFEVEARPSTAPQRRALPADRRHRFHLAGRLAQLRPAGRRHRLHLANPWAQLHLAGRRHRLHLANRACSQPPQWRLRAAPG
ncbi:MAG: SDR family NAD(P)-dependent oxidoreductase, partial [Alphaproteobacteria bacterium]